MATPLARYSIVEVSEARIACKRDTGEDDALVRAANAATAFMEKFCGRPLRHRTFRDAVTLSVTTTAGSPAAVATGALAGDAVTGPSLGLLELGRVDAVSGTAVTLNAPATVTATADHVFGSEAALLDGYDPTTPVPRLWLPTWPVTALYSVNELSGEDAMEVDLTGARIVPAACGLVELPYAALPRSRSHVIRVEYAGGYQRPTASARGNDEWWELHRLALRLVQVFYGDETSNRGRRMDLLSGTMSASITAWDLPKDVIDGLNAYAEVV